MKVLHIADFQHLPRRRTEKPAGLIEPLSWWQPDVVEVDMCCVDCIWRWTELVPVPLMAHPQWMGLYDCPGPACGGEGTAVRG